MEIREEWKRLFKLVPLAEAVQEAVKARQALEKTLLEIKMKVGKEEIGNDTHHIPKSARS